MICDCLIHFHFDLLVNIKPLPLVTEYNSSWISMNTREPTALKTLNKKCLPGIMAEHSLCSFSTAHYISALQRGLFNALLSTLPLLPEGGVCKVAVCIQLPDVIYCHLSKVNWPHSTVDFLYCQRAHLLEVLPRIFLPLWQLTVNQHKKHRIKRQ